MSIFIVFYIKAQIFVISYILTLCNCSSSEIKYTPMAKIRLFVILSYITLYISNMKFNNYYSHGQQFDFKFQRKTKWFSICGKFTLIFLNAISIMGKWRAISWRESASTISLICQEDNIIRTVVLSITFFINSHLKMRNIQEIQTMTSTSPIWISIYR